MPSITTLNIDVLLKCSYKAVKVVAQRLDDLLLSTSSTSGSLEGSVVYQRTRVILRGTIRVIIVRVRER